MPCIDFVLIGAMKSGTTTFMQYLHRHPGIFISAQKELQYFSRDYVYERGLEWYESHFLDAKEGQLRGEGSTCYTRVPKYPDSAARLHAYAPDVKLVYLVREPVARAYSHFRHGCLLNEWSYDSFHDALREEDEIVSSGRYMMQISEYRELFPRENMHFVRFEDLVSEPDQVFRSLFDFLEIDYFDVVGDSPLVSNAAAEGGVRMDAKRYLKRARNLPVVSKFIDLFSTREQREVVINFLTKVVVKSYFGQKSIESRKSVIPGMTDEDRKYIFECSLDDLVEFEKFSGLDLSNWYAS